MFACYGHTLEVFGLRWSPFGLRRDFPTSLSQLDWNPKGKVLAQGGNKSVFRGNYAGGEAVICLARETHGDIERVKNEIDVLQAMGRNPYIINLLAHGYHGGRPYLVLEQVNPIGFDMERLRLQYERVGSKLPALLCGRLFEQMADGLQFMHGRRILHLDLKAQNVLVTLDYTAKLCDFGVARQTGTVYQLRACYMSPELCMGSIALGPPADCWGLGLILHQMYQRGDGNLVESWRYGAWNRVKAQKRDGVPGKGSMPREVRQVMVELIQDDPAQRLTLEGLLESSWLSTATRPPCGMVDASLIVVREYLSPPVRLGGAGVRILSAYLSAVVDPELCVDCTEQLQDALAQNGHVWLFASAFLLPEVQDPAPGRLKRLSVVHEGVNDVTASAALRFGCAVLCEMAVSAGMSATLGAGLASLGVGLVTSWQAAGILCMAHEGGPVDACVRACVDT